MEPYFRIRETRDHMRRRRWRFNLIAANGESIATSESYNSWQSAAEGAQLVRQCAAEAEVRPG